MSYQRKPTTLIAREGYSDYLEVGSSDYMMMPGSRLEIGPGGKPYETLGDTLGTLRKIGEGVVGVVTGKARSEGEAEAYKQIAMQQGAKSSEMPSWLLPVAIGGVGLIAILMLRK